MVLNPDVVREIENDLNWIDTHHKYPYANPHAWTVFRDPHYQIKIETLLNYLDNNQDIEVEVWGEKLEEMSIEIIQEIGERHFVNTLNQDHRRWDQSNYTVHEMHENL